MAKIPVTLYVRERCGLCREAYFLLKYLERDFPLALSLVDITGDPELERQYALEVPVVEIGGETALVSAIGEEELRRKLQSYMEQAHFD